VQSAEPVHRRLRELRVGDADRIVGIQNGLILRKLRFEEASFSGGVVLKRMVPVQMILRDVQSERDVRAEIEDRFQLEAR
jgi:hypothetical protein